MIQEIIKSLIPEPYTYGSKITKQDIDAYEKKIQYSLPEAYRLFLLMTNGGVPVNHFVWTRGIDCLWHRQSPNSFLGLHTRESWSELGMIENSSGNSRHGYLPIAYDPGGNRLLMNLNTDDIFYPYGAIYFSDDEYILGYVAPSFSTYLILLEAYSSDENYHFHKRIGTILEEDDSGKLENMILQGKWRLDEVYANGNTLADIALRDGKRHIFRKLVEMGARVPRFFLYAHATLSEMEIVDYLKSGKL